MAGTEERWLPLWDAAELANRLYGPRHHVRPAHVKSAGRAGRIRMQTADWSANRYRWVVPESDLRGWLEQRFGRPAGGERGEDG